MDNLELLLNVTARFIHMHTGHPIHGEHYRVRLFDKDHLNDDFLGETYLNQEGKAHFKINPAQYRGGDSPLETKPDFYLTILKNGQEIFTSPAAKNINLETEGNFNSSEGEWIDLGTFLIDG